MKKTLNKMNVKEKVDWLLDSVKEEIRDNLCFIEDVCELDILVKVRELQGYLSKVEIEFPENKKWLNQIFVGFRQNAFELAFHLCTPFNKSVVETLRVMIENLIVLTFLVENDACYTQNWFYFMTYNLPEISRKNVETEDFLNWQKKFREQVGEDNFEKITKRADYGWAFPYFNRRVTLKDIALSEDCFYEYDRFKSLSPKVHSNNAMQVLQSERFEQDTMLYCFQLADICKRYLYLIEPFVVNNFKCYYDAIKMCDAISEVFRKYTNKKFKLNSETNN